MVVVVMAAACGGGDTPAPVTAAETADVVATGAPAETAPPAPAEGSTGLDPASVTLDTMGLPYSWQANLVPATPYDNSQPPGPEGLPERIQITFGVTDPQDRQPGDPVLYIIPVEAYKQLWEAGGDPTVTNIVEHLWTVLTERPTPIPPFGMPVLPLEGIGAGVNDLAVQGHYMVLPAGDGVRFVGRFAQDANPVTNEGLRYLFQGFSRDGKYLISFFYPVTTPELPASMAEVPAQEQEQVQSDPLGYLEGKAAQLNALAPADWEPDLATLDAVLSSLSFEAPAQP
jgi:hypothetical protein